MCYIIVLVRSLSAPRNTQANPPQSTAKLSPDCISRFAMCGTVSRIAACNSWAINSILVCLPIPLLMYSFTCPLLTLSKRYSCSIVAIWSCIFHLMALCDYPLLHNHVHQYSPLYWDSPRVYSYFTVGIRGSYTNYCHYLGFYHSWSYRPIVPRSPVVWLPNTIPLY